MTVCQYVGVTVAAVSGCYCCC